MNSPNEMREGDVDRRTWWAVLLFSPLVAWGIVLLFYVVDRGEFFSAEGLLCVGFIHLAVSIAGCVVSGVAIIHLQQREEIVSQQPGHLTRSMGVELRGAVISFVIPLALICFFALLYAPIGWWGMVLMLFCWARGLSVPG